MIPSSSIVTQPTISKKKTTRNKTSDETKNLSFSEAKQKYENSYSAVLFKNIYNALPVDVTEDREFPELPVSKFVKNPKRHPKFPYTLSRNSLTPWKQTTNSNIMSSQGNLANENNSKRKATSPLIQPTPDNKFPFRFGPPNEICKYKKYCR